jgi:hypothetical protein
MENACRHENAMRPTSFRLSCLSPLLVAFIAFGLGIHADLAATDAPPPSFVAPDLPVIPQTTFTVTDPAYGAVGDGSTDNTTAIQATINAASAAGGGIVSIPAGTYLCGPLQMANSINLRLESTNTILRMLPLDQYPGGSTNPANFIGGKNLHDVAVTGTGTIDGQGAPWWPHYKDTSFNRPRMIALSGCTRTLIQGVTLQNSPMFHIAVSGMQHMTVRGVTILAPASDDPVTPGHNTDACDIGGQHFLIENCNVSVGDDNFTCGGNTSDVLISHCTYGKGHGVSIGSYTGSNTKTGRVGVSNITVTDCTFTGTECGVRIKSDRDRGGIVQNITYQNLTMTGVNYPILVYGAYMATDAKYRDLTKLTGAIAATYPSQPVTDTTPIFKNISFINITATAAKGRRAGLVWGLPEAHASSILLKDVHITADLPFGLYDVDGVNIFDTQITTPSSVSAWDQTATTQVVTEDTPIAPTALTASNSIGHIVLTWQASTGATTYTVQRATVSGGPYITVASGLTATTWTDTDAGNGARFYYVVMAVNDVGTSPISAEANSACLIAPTGLVATAGNAQVTLTWNAVEAAASYTVQRRMNDADPWTIRATALTTTTYVDAEVSNGSTYSYQILAISGEQSQASVIVSATPTAPVTGNTGGDSSSGGSSGGCGLGGALSFVVCALGGLLRLRRPQEQ